MNERIRLLAEHSGIVIPKDSEYNGHIYRNSIEKFAELIVQECAEWLKQPVNQTPLSGAVMNIAADRLKEHFGVEESKGWVCSKCGTDRTKQECPKGYTAALTGECPMIGVAQ